jgi:hypothetical protein
MQLHKVGFPAAYDQAVIYRAIPGELERCGDIALLSREVRIIADELESQVPALTGNQRILRCMEGSVILHFTRYSKYGPSRARLPWQVWCRDGKSNDLVTNLLTYSDASEPIAKVEREASSPRRCIASWGIQKNSQSILHWLPLFKKFSGFISDMASSLDAIGAEDTEIAMTKRLQDKYQQDRSACLAESWALFVCA